MTRIPLLGLPKALAEVDEADPDPEACDQEKQVH
jgi:hypothetical protein